MPERILFVDDDPNILAGFQRQLGRSHQIETAGSGAEALSLFTENGSYSVIVTDMRMPGMDGIQLLSKVREISPDTVRMMLTGFADLQLAMEAVNEGRIFRILTKPCAPEAMERALEAALEQHRLISAEKVLLEKTLVGSVRVLMEILSVVNPAAFGIAVRIRRLAVFIVGQLRLADAWQYELGAALSQIGWITLSLDLQSKIIARQPLTASEEDLYARHPQAGRKLLENIPRMELIAQMIEGQGQYNPAISFEKLVEDRDTAQLGAQIIRVASEYDRLMMSGQTHEDVLAYFGKNRHRYLYEIAMALQSYHIPAIVGSEAMIEKVKLDNLQPGMVLAEDVVDRSGASILSKGQELTYPALTHLFSVVQRMDANRLTFKVLA